jgi:hypothetical protein
MLLWALGQRSHGRIVSIALSSVILTCAFMTFVLQTVENFSGYITVRCLHAMSMLDATLEHAR